jgi:hypothetical protein
MNLMNWSKSFKSPEIRFESSTVALTNLTTSEVAVRAHVLAVEVEVEGRY